MKFLNYIKPIFWLGCIIYLLTCAYFGLSILLNAIILYLLIYKIVEFILKKIISNPEKLTNLKLTALSFLICFIIAEIALRNLTLKYSIYLEKSGYITYVSQYNPNSHLWQKYFGGKKNPNLQIRSPKTKYELTTTEFKYLHEYNNLGLRDSLPILNDSTYLLITLGDSFTEGFGAPLDSTWTQILNQKISLENDNFELLNAGIGGSDVFYEYYKLKNHLLPKYQPNEVIIAVNSSDILDVILRGGNIRFSDTKRKNIAPWWEPFYGISFLFRAFIHDVIGVKWHLLSEEKYLRVQSAAYHKVCNCLTKDYADLAKENQFRYRVIFHPNIWELETNDNAFKDCSKQLDQFNIENINLFDSFNNLENPHDYYWSIDTHNNSKGYELWANKVYHDWYSNE